MVWNSIRPPDSDAAAQMVPAGIVISLWAAEGLEKRIKPVALVPARLPPGRVERTTAAQGEGEASFQNSTAPKDPSSRSESSRQVALQEQSRLCSGLTSWESA